MDQLSSIGGGQEGIAVLLVIGQLAKRNYIIGGIKNQQVPKLRVLINCRQVLGIAALRKLDGNNHMVESSVRRRLFGVNAALVMNRHVIRLDADLGQHGSKQSGFIFAISILLSK